MLKIKNKRVQLVGLASFWQVSDIGEWTVKSFSMKQFWYVSQKALIPEKKCLKNEYKTRTKAHFTLGCSGVWYNYSTHLAEHITKQLS